jgi:integrase
MLILNRICILERGGRQDGDLPVNAMEARNVRSLRDEVADRPAVANSIIKTLRQLFGWAVDAGLMRRNPARDVPYLAGNPDGFHTWTVEEVEQFERRHPIGTKARLALALLLYTGVRRSDVARLGRQMSKDGWLRFTEVKDHARKPKAREIPILPLLKNVLAATPGEHMTYLVTKFGAPFTHGGFGN